jgi:hypothetical protein
MAQNGDMSVVGRALLDFSQKWLLPLVMAFGGWQYTEINKLEDRINMLQREAVTQAQLQISENRMSTVFDLKLSRVEQKMDSVVEKQEQTNSYLREFIQEMRKEKARH